MTTYSKETALYDTGAIATDIGTAGNNAKGYMTNVSNDGVFVHEYDTSNPQPTDTGENGVHIHDSVDIIRDGDVVASYGEEVRLGSSEEGATRLILDSRSLTGYSEEVEKFSVDFDGESVPTRAALFNKNMNPPYPSMTLSGGVLTYNYDAIDLSEYDISDGDSIFVKATPQIITSGSEFFNSDDGTNSNWYGWGDSLSAISVGVAEFTYNSTTQQQSYEGAQVTVYKDNVPTTAQIRFRAKPVLTFKLENKMLKLSITVNPTTGSIPTNTYSVRITNFIYEGERTISAPSFSFGTKRETVNPPFSSTLGLGLWSARNCQTVIGKYNRPSATKYVFIIGNGTSDAWGSRSNAFTVDEDGNVEAAGDYYSKVNHISLGTYITGGILTGSGSYMHFSIPTGRVFPDGTTISKLTFNIVVRAGNHNASGLYIVKNASGGTDVKYYDSTASFQFYNGANQSKTLTTAMSYITLQGGTNIYVLWQGSGDYFFSGTSTYNGYVNNQPIVIMLTNITATLNIPS